MMKLASVVAKEFGTVQGHVPFVLARLPDLNPMAQRVAALYLRWRMGRMDTIHIHQMIESGQVSVEEMDYAVSILD